MELRHTPFQGMAMLIGVSKLGRSDQMRINGFAIAGPVPELNCTWTAKNF
jgi:hypothetical protein